MKKSNMFFVGALLVTLLFSACDFLSSSSSISAHIDAFMNDVNRHNYSNLKSYFHPTETEMYNAITDDFWKTIFKNDEQYTLAAYVPVGDTVTTIISGGTLYDSGKPIIFVMAKYGSAYKIKTLTIAGHEKVRLLSFE